MHTVCLSKFVSLTYLPLTPLLGPIVRIGPNEVHIRDSGFTPRFFSSASSNRLDKYAPHRRQLGITKSTISTVQSDLHQRRREALAPFLSSARIGSYTSVILCKIENIASRFEKCRLLGEVAELRLFFLYMVTDIITEIAFPEGTNLLAHEELDKGYYTFQKAGQAKLLWFKHFPIIWTLLKNMPPSWLLRMAPQASVAVHWEIANKRLVMDILSGNRNVDRRTVIHHLAASSLPSSEKGFDRIWEESTSFLGAGGETVVNALCTTIFHVLKDDKITQRLAEEVKAAVPDPSRIPSAQVLASLPYLSAVIQEGQRKALGITSRIIRVDNKSSISYGSYVLPQGTAVSLSSLLENNDPTMFPNPEEFIPERWLEGRADSSLKEMKKQVITFGGGPRKCLGEHLAQAEILLVLTVLFRRFRLRLYRTSDMDVAPMYDSLLPKQWEGSKGLRVTVP